MRRILFVLPDTKILYDNGKIKEVERIYYLEGTEIRFARRLIYDKENNKNVTTFIWTNRNVKLNGYTLRQIYEELLFHQFILFIDHEKKDIELLIDDGRNVKFSYSDIGLIKEFFQKLGGMLLESDIFKNLELFSYDDEEAVVESIKKLENMSFLKKIIHSLEKYFKK